MPLIFFGSSSILKHTMTQQTITNDNASIVSATVTDDPTETQVFIDASNSAGPSTHTFGTPTNGDINLTLPDPSTNPGQRVFIVVKSHLSSWTTGNRPSNANIIYLLTPSGVTVLNASTNWVLLNTSLFDVNTVTLVSDGGTKWIIESTK